MSGERERNIRERNIRERNIRERNIRERAYAIWEKEGRPDGKSLDYWLQAEGEIGNERIIGVTNNGKILKSTGSGGAVRY